MKLCVLFPGVGYSVDRPLLYFSKKLATAQGYEIRDISYHDLPHISRDNKLDDVKLKAYSLAVEQAAECLADVKWDEYEDILFVGKSIGTIVAAALAENVPYSGTIRFIYFTPLSYTFNHVKPASGPVFTGTADPWVIPDEIRAKSEEFELPYYSFENANHSLETDDVMTNIDYLHEIFDVVSKYI